MKARFKKHILQFKIPGGTSRGVLTEKETWFLILEDNNYTGIGECSPIWGLSIEKKESYESHIIQLCQLINEGKEIQADFFIEIPSITFGYEMALLDLDAKGNKLLFNNDFSQSKKGQIINGLIWMGNYDFMVQQINAKINEGFNCIKLKIGALNFEEELSILKYIRSNKFSQNIILRVDANGAFSPNEALEKLNLLAKYNIHSIEQPIKQKQWEQMADLCAHSPIPIVLDEELIGVPLQDAEMILTKIKPQYIILKPSLIGGFKAAVHWITLAKKHNIGWWVTSALESNIGLNAICQWTYELDQHNMHHGLGTGQLYSNNLLSPLQIHKGSIYYQQSAHWDLTIALQNNNLCI